jgi:hypothetical protein
MASGSSITITGGTNMTQVVVGDNIEDGDFNNARTNIGLMLGNAADVTLGTYTASSTYGYTQGGAGVSAASAGGLVYADNATGGFKRLQDDIQALCAFTGQAVRTGVGSDVADGDSITAAMWSNVMLNIEDCWNNRFTPSSRTSSTIGTTTYTSTWYSTLSQETTFTFASETACRGFFNGGGRIGFSASRASGGSTTQNTDWTNLLSAMGDVYLDLNTGGGSSGTNAGKGFYELSTSYQQLWQKFGSGSYASNYIKISGKINSTTNPTVVTLKMDCSDPHAEGSGTGPDGVPGNADDGYGNDYIDGTFTLNARSHTPDASGSGFTFTAPTDSMGSISGS